MTKVRFHQPVSGYVKFALHVGEAWAAVHSFKNAQFVVEDLCTAVEKNHRSFVEGAGEDWQVIGIFASPEEAADTLRVWLRRPGNPPMNPGIKKTYRKTPGNIRGDESEV